MTHIESVLTVPRSNNNINSYNSLVERLPAYAILVCVCSNIVWCKKKMSCQRNAGKITVPDELRDVLLEFTISYLLEQPVDIIDYAVGFFTQLRESRQTQLIEAPAQTASSTPDESVEEGKPANFHSGCDFPSRRVFLPNPSDTLVHRKTFSARYCFDFET